MKRSLILAMMLVVFFSCSGEQNNSLVNNPNDSNNVVSEKKDSIIDSALIDTLELDSINSDTNTNDTLDIDTVKTDTIQIDTIPKDTIEIDTISNDTAEFDSLELYKDSECIGCEPFRYFSDTTYNKFLTDFRNKYAIDIKDLEEQTKTPQKSSSYNFTLKDNSYFSKVTVWQEMNYLNVEVTSNVFKKIKVYVTATPNPTEEDFKNGYSQEFEGDFTDEVYNSKQINMIGMYGSNKNYYIQIVGIDESGSEYKLSDYLDKNYITIYVPKYFTLQDEKYESVIFNNFKNRSEAFGDWVLIGVLDDDFIVYDTNGILDTLKIADRKQFIFLDSTDVNSSTMSLNNKFFGDNIIEWTDDCKIIQTNPDGEKFHLVCSVKDDFLYLYPLEEEQIEKTSPSIITHTQKYIFRFARRSLFTKN